MATHSIILARKIPWTEEPGKLQSLVSQTVGHNGVTEHAHVHKIPSISTTIVLSEVNIISWPQSLSSSLHLSQVCGGRLCVLSSLPCRQNQWSLVKAYSQRVGFLERHLNCLLCETFAVCGGPVWQHFTTKVYQVYQSISTKVYQRSIPSWTKIQAQFSFL